MDYLRFARFFVDASGIIYTIFADGKSNFDKPFHIDEPNELSPFSRVQIFSDSDEGDSETRFIQHEYVLWDSLSRLFSTIKPHSKEPSRQIEMTSWSVA